MSKRALILVLSIIVIGVALAGLQGILNLMANRGPIQTTEKQTPVTVNGQPIPTKSVTSTTPKSAEPKSVKFPFDISPVNGLAAAFPGLDIDPEGGLLPHVPLFKLNGNLDSAYLRSSVASIYQNGLWKYDTSLPVNNYKGEKTELTVEGYARKSLSNITLEPLADFGKNKMPIPSAQYVNKLTASFALSYNSGNRIFISDSGIPGSYSFEAINYVFDEDALRKASIDADPSALEIPREITARTRQLAADLTRNISSPYLKAKAIEQYLKEECVYDLNYKPAPDGQEPNDWFLFDEQKGVCSNFNSAFVVLARSAGIPARLVSGYRVNPTSPTQSVFSDQAHAWSEIKLQKMGWVTLDATGSGQTELIATSTEITQVSTVVEKSTPFSVEGKVNAETAAVDGTLVELFINREKTIKGGILVGQGLVTDGSFSIEATIPAETPVGNYQLIARSSQTPRYEESISDPVIKVMSDTLLSLANVPKIKIGQALTINGQLVESSKQAIAGQTVDIEMNGQFLTAVVTDSKGKFEYKTILMEAGKYDIAANFAGSEYYYPCEKGSSLQVLLPTTLSIQVPSRLKSGQTIKAEGILLNSASQSPAANQTIELLVDSKSTGVKSSTDKNGHYVLEYRIKETGIHQLEARYVSQPYFWDASARAAIEITVANNKMFLGMILMISGVVIASGYMGFRYFRKHPLKHKISLRKKKSKATPVESTLAMPETRTESVHSEAVTQNSIARLDLSFPGIVAPLPDVWGIDDDFDLNCSLKKNTGEPMAARPIEISMGSPITTLTTDEKGRSNVTLAFSEKGTFEVEAIYHSAEDGNTDIRAVKAIRIVDYREEIIAGYRSWLEWLRQKGVSISDDNSPREAEKMIVNSGLSVSPDSLEAVISGFEEATYSLHQITRQNYVKMYFALEDIRENDNQQEQPPE